MSLLGLSNFHPRVHSVPRSPRLPRASRRLMPILPQTSCTGQSLSGEFGDRSRAGNSSDKYRVPRLLALQESVCWITLPPQWSRLSAPSASCLRPTRSPLPFTRCSRTEYPLRISRISPLPRSAPPRWPMSFCAHRCASDACGA